eukprot:TRINITY_DN12517_c1_g1_i1.p2 TRINITY_DN12517_c1_g1~~TRINITY_DN12517_c1_g1_i1.p2  ORF type:complete len:301 (+),score=62.54 TRINITY_DN12517_c1_g1_i1:1551-2453(+)
MERVIQALRTSNVRVSFLNGAGVSVAAGIPDFRSPGGMYDTLRPELLTASHAERALMAREPTAVVSTEIFYNNQLPYLEVRRPFMLGIAEGVWQPTLTHRFAAMLHKRNMLQRVLTQNIDGLDYMTGLPPDKIVSVHGSLGRIQCEACQADMPMEDFRALVRTNIKDIYQQDPSAPATSTPIPCPNCTKPQVKPATVLYGGQLPSDFFISMEADLPMTDLLFVCGTSLTVAPASQVPFYLGKDAFCVLINRDNTFANIGLADDADSNRIFLQGDCDAVVSELLEQVGWDDGDVQTQQLPS